MSLILTAVSQRCTGRPSPRGRVSMAGAGAAGSYSQRWYILPHSPGKEAPQLLQEDAVLASPEAASLRVWGLRGPLPHPERGPTEPGTRRGRAPLRRPPSSTAPSVLGYTPHSFPEVTPEVAGCSHPGEARIRQRLGSETAQGAGVRGGNFSLRFPSSGSYRLSQGSEPRSCLTFAHPPLSRPVRVSSHTV